MAIDPNGWNVNDLQSANKETEDAIRREEEEKRRLAEQEALAKQKAEQEAAISKDSHAAKPANEFGVKENFKEIGNALVGGVRDTASSIATAPERAADMANGQMEAQQKQDAGYKPDWDPLGGDKNPITKTWWGNLLRGGVHFGTMALAIAGASRIPGVRGVVGKAAATGVGKAIAGNTLARAAAVGAASDLVSEYSQDDNATGALAKRFPQLDNPLATHDADHPAMKTLKNVVEGMGIGLVFDGVALSIGSARNRLGKTNKPDREVLQAIDARLEASRAAAEEATKVAVDKDLRKLTTQKLFEKGGDFNALSEADQIAAMKQVAKKHKGFESWTPPGEDNISRAVRKADERSKSVDDQIIEKGEIEMDDPEFRGHKNKPIADSWQGSPNSTGRAYDVAKQAKRVSREWGAENGSTDSLVTPAAAERMSTLSDIAPEAHEAIARDLLGDARYDSLMRELKSRGLPAVEVFNDALDRLYEVVKGRNTDGLTPEEYWEPIMRHLAMTGGEDNLAYWATREVIAADLINASLFKQIRDLATASREIHGVADVLDVDGPMKTMRDRLIMGITNVKRSRYLVSDTFRDLQLHNKAQATAAKNKRLAELHGETVEAVDTMIAIAAKAKTDDFLQAVLEAFSMSNKISNFDDLDKWMRGRLLGMTTDEGVAKTGALVKELEAVMVHSILSGPKTPVRALLGTGTATFTRPLSMAIGSLVRGDITTMRASLASSNAMVQAIPEAFNLFKTKLNAYWAGDIATVRSRFSEYSTADEQWKLMEWWANERGSKGDQAAFWMADIARKMNHNSFFTYSTKLMAATDDAFGYILGRARAREKALREALDMHKVGDLPVVNKEVIGEFEDRFMKDIFDADGNITDEALKFAQKEVTLTQDLSGFGEGLEKLMNSAPWTKPFFLFARTGINGLELMAKHMPGISLLVKESRDILYGSADNLVALKKYGIETATDLENAKALMLGRQAVGTAVAFMSIQKFMNGELTGNGPTDRQKRKVWEDAGWKPRSIKLGDAWVTYDALEPFNGILAAIADVGDNLELMGPEWAELNFARIALIITQGVVSKSYLSGISSLMDVVSGDPAALGKIGANISNNVVPFAGLRNELGKLFTPYTRELNSSITDAIRNRNLISEHLTNDPLPIKYDILTGRPIRDHDFPTRMFNMISPVQFNLDDSPGRQLLFASGYDVRTSVYTSPTGVNLTKNAKVRSLYQRAIGNQNLEKTLNELAKRRDVRESLAKMSADLDAGRRMIDPMKAYLHNDLIRIAFDNAKKKAWAEIQSYPEVQRAVAQKAQSDRLTYNTRNSNTQSATDSYQRLVQLQNK
jgi:hypothetical protein